MTRSVVLRRARNLRYYRAHRVEICANQRARRERLRQADPAGFVAECSAINARYYQRHRVRLIAAANAYYHANKAQISARRKARKAVSAGP